MTTGADTTGTGADATGAETIGADTTGAGADTAGAMAPSVTRAELMLIFGGVTGFGVGGVPADPLDALAELCGLF